MTHQDVAFDRECVKISSTDLLLGGHDHVHYIEQVLHFVLFLFDVVDL
jgi:hypothetical protein